MERIVLKVLHTCMCELHLQPLNAVSAITNTSLTLLLHFTFQLKGELPLGGCSSNSKVFA